MGRYPNNNSKYAGSKYYQTKLSNIMKKLGIDRFKYQYQNDTAFINFKFGSSWYQLDHSIAKARINNPGINNAEDVFAELVLTMEDLQHIADRNITSFKNLISPFELKPGRVELPECFTKLGFDGRFMPAEKHVEYKYNDLAKVLDPDKTQFGDKEKFEELQKIRLECLDYIKKHS